MRLRHHVSIHAPVWGATRRGAWRWTAGCRFNPRARVGRDFLARWCQKGISVFQSTRPCGARHLADGDLSVRDAVSIHAPVWGATSLFAQTATRCVQFQSTRPCGARPADARLRDAFNKVSIHAPVWGATSSTAAPTATCGCFNPRARVGRDTGAVSLERLMQLFQSTRPCGARPLTATREPGMSEVSIHAPVWGATPLTWSN